MDTTVGEDLGVDARLPAGRRGTAALSPAQVTEHQRGRILLAMIQAAAEVGYAAVTVADVVTRAGVSRATFYEQFTDKRACFLSAWDASAELLLAGRGGQATASLNDVLAHYLDTVAANLSYARVFTVEIGALGAEGVRRRAAHLERYAEAVGAITGASDDPGRFASRAFVSAIAMLVSARVADDDAAGVRALQQPLLHLASTIFGRGRAGV